MISKPDSAVRPERNIVIFGMVGILATAVHFSVGLSIVGLGVLRPFWANVAAFLAAFVVSYVGHHRFTFRSAVAHQRSLPKFFFVAVLGLVINQVIVFIMVDTLGLQYIFALLVVVLLVPAMTYLLGKMWVFREVTSDEASCVESDQ